MEVTKDAKPEPLKECTYTRWAQCLLFPSTFRRLESVPTPFRSVEVVGLSSFVAEDMYSVVTHIVGHQRTPKFEDPQTPTPRRLAIVLSGVIYALSSEIGIDGDSMFTNNSADSNGGDKRRET